MCHTRRFYAMSFVIWDFVHVLPDICLSSFSWSSSLSLLFPCIFTITLMETWPYYHSHFCLTKVIIGSMLVSLQMSSFLTWSFLLLPLAHLSSLISLAWSHVSLNCVHMQVHVVVVLILRAHVNFNLVFASGLFVSYITILIFVCPPRWFSTRSFFIGHSIVTVR